MEVSIKKVKNGFVVEASFENDEGEFVEETHVFSKYNQVIKFLRENFKDTV